MDGCEFGISRPGQISERRKPPMRTMEFSTKISFLDNYGNEVHSPIRYINKEMFFVDNSSYTVVYKKKKIFAHVFNQFLT